jgi:hypothetical protein
MRPRWIWMLLLFFAALAGPVCYLTLSFWYPPPRLTCPESEYDFGAVKPGGQYGHTFSLVNTGGRLLIIKKVETTCNCTNAKVSAYQLRPGQGAQLDVVMRVEERETQATAYVLIESTDPGDPTRRIRLSAEPSSMLMISPPSIDMGTIRYGHASERSVEATILCREPRDLEVEVEDLMNQSPIHVKVVQDSVRPRLRVWLDRDTPIGPLTGMIRLSLRPGDPDTMRQSVQGDVVGAIRAEPALAYLDLTASKETRSTQVEILSEPMARRPQIRIVNVTTPLNTAITAQIVERSGRTYLDIAAREQQPVGGLKRLRGIIALECAEEEKLNMNVPLYIFTR